MNIRKLLKEKENTEKQITEAFREHRSKCKYHLAGPIDGCSCSIKRNLSETIYGYRCICSVGRCPTI